MATGNQGKRCQWLSSRDRLPACAGLGHCLPGTAPGGHGRAGCLLRKALGSLSRTVRGASVSRRSRFLPLDCRCWCLITASSSASRSAPGLGAPLQPRAGWHHPILQVHLPQLVFPVLFTSSSSNKFIFVCWAGPRLPTLWSEGWCLILLPARDKS